MVRRALFLAVGLFVAPALAAAQTSFTVREAVDVRKAPVTSSPVVGHAARGTTIQLTRDVGDWAQVAWPDSPDRVGYVRVRFNNTLLPAFQGLSAIRSTPALASEQAQIESPAPDERASLSAPHTEHASDARDPRGMDPLAYELPAHTVGFGVQMEPTMRAFGLSGRLWSASRFGVQVELGRSSMASNLVPARLTTIRFSPSALYALPDVVSGSVWVRPYVGSGLDITRSTFRSIPPGTTMRENEFGMKIFGGGEMTFPGAPQVAVSADLGYHWLDAPFTGFEVGGLRATLAAHWYVK